MNIIFLLMSRLSVRYKGSQKELCSDDLPCDYNVALRLAKNNSNIFFKEKNNIIESDDHINAFRSFLLNISHPSIEFYFNNLIINGTKSPIYDNSFLFFNGATNIIFQNITFINFSQPILLFRKCEGLFLNSVTISNCHVSKRIFAACFSVCNVMFDHLSIIDSSCETCNFMILSSTSAYFESCLISNNCAFGYNMPLISLLNTVVDIINCNISENVNKAAPIICSDFNNYINLEASVLSNNSAPSIMHCNGSFVELYVNETKFNNNFGICFSIQCKGKLVVWQAQFKRNQAFNKSIIEIMYISAEFYQTCFSQNHGYSSIYIHHGSNVVIKNGVIFDDFSQKGIISSKSKLTIRKSTLESELLLYNSFINLSHVIIEKGKYIQIQSYGGHLIINNLMVQDSIDIFSPAIKARQTNVIITNSTFFDSYKYKTKIFDIDNVPVLEYLTFNSSNIQSLGLFGYKCTKCSFHKSLVAPLILIGIMMAIILILLIKKRVRIYKKQLAKFDL